MNTEKNQIEIEEELKSPGESANQARRSFLRMGAVAAPVIMTLASKPVFAMQGLSNMLSTTGSHAAKLDCFNGGYNLAFWQNVTDATTEAAWRTATNTGATGNAWSNVTVATAFLGHQTHGMTGKLKDIVTAGGNNAIIVCGLLNLRVFGGNGARNNYFITEADFWAMNDGTKSVPQYDSNPSPTFVGLITYGMSQPGPNNTTCVL